MSLRFALELMFMPPAQFGKKSSPAAVGFTSRVLTTCCRNKVIIPRVHSGHQHAVGFTPRLLTACSRDRVSIPRVNSGTLTCLLLWIDSTVFRDGGFLDVLEQTCNDFVGGHSLGLCLEIRAQTVP